MIFHFPDFAVATNSEEAVELSSKIKLSNFS